MMLSIAQLIRLTPRKIQRNANLVRVYKSLFKAHVDKDIYGEHKVVQGQVRATDGKRNVVFKLYGRMDPDGTMTNRAKAWVHCDCPYFRYYVEVALSARKSSDVIVSNGQFPKIRNPNMRPYLCKHLLKAAPLALKLKPVHRRRTAIEKSEIDMMVKLLGPLVPRSA
jgi:hypothetical protein